MKAWIAVMILALTLWPSAVRAELLVKDYEESKSNPKMRSYIFGVGLGFLGPIASWLATTNRSSTVCRQTLR